MKHTIKGNLPFFLGYADDTATMWIDLANKLDNEMAELLIGQIPVKFENLTSTPISRYSEMEILELIINEVHRVQDTKLGPLQYYARKRLLELHNNPKVHDSNTDSELPQTSSSI
jgi:hypothetical protein